MQCTQVKYLSNCSQTLLHLFLLIKVLNFLVILLYKLFSFTICKNKDTVSNEYDYKYNWMSIINKSHAHSICSLQQCIGLK
jgi:hypothetical protein